MLLAGINILTLEGEQIKCITFGKTFCISFIYIYIFVCHSFKFNAFSFHSTQFSKTQEMFCIFYNLSFREIPKLTLILLAFFFFFLGVEREEIKKQQQLQVFCTKHKTFVDLWKLRTTTHPLKTTYIIIIHIILIRQDRWKLDANIVLYLKLFVCCFKQTLFLFLLPNVNFYYNTYIIYPQHTQIFTFKILHSFTHRKLVKQCFCNFILCFFFDCCCWESESEGVEWKKQKSFYLCRTVEEFLLFNYCNNTSKNK